MIEEYGWSIVIAVYLTYVLGIGLLSYVIFLIWLRAIDLFLPLFNFHKEFLAWVYEKYKPKVYTPKLSEERLEELRSSLTRKKEDEE